MKTFTKWMVMFSILLVATGAMSVMPASAAPGAHVRVPADAGWVASGVFFTTGDSFDLRANGMAITGPLSEYPGARSGPDGQTTLCLVAEVPFTPCALEGAPYGALVGKIGVGGTPFLIGSGGSFVAGNSGELFLSVNDNQTFFGDNRGGFNAFVMP
jgi:hypothetical protein